MTVEDALNEVLKDAKEQLKARFKDEFDIDEVSITGFCRAISSKNEIRTFNVNVGLVKDPGKETQKVLVAAKEVPAAGQAVPKAV